MYNVLIFHYLIIAYEQTYLHKYIYNIWNLEYVVPFSINVNQKIIMSFVKHILYNMF